MAKGDVFKQGKIRFRKSAETGTIDTVMDKTTLAELRGGNVTNGMIYVKVSSK